MSEELDIRIVRPFPPPVTIFAGAPAAVKIPVVVRGLVLPCGHRQTLCLEIPLTVALLEDHAFHLDTFLTRRAREMAEGMRHRRDILPCSACAPATPAAA